MDLIQSAPDHLVRATLIALCSDRSQLAKAKDYLSKMGHIAATPATDNSLKRKAEDEVKICVQCQEPYYEADNIGEGSCKYHNGELDHDHRSSVWDDWDEGCFGEQDTEENREEYPDGFIWSCCDKDGTHPGCTRGPHRAVGATRGRYSLQGLNKNGNSRDGRSSNEDEEGEEEEDEE